MTRRKKALCDDYQSGRTAAALFMMLYATRLGEKHKELIHVDYTNPSASLRRKRKPVQLLYIVEKFVPPL